MPTVWNNAKRFLHKALNNNSHTNLQSVHIVHVHVLYKCIYAAGFHDTGNSHIAFLQATLNRHNRRLIQASSGHVMYSGYKKITNQWCAVYKHREPHGRVLKQRPIDSWMARKGRLNVQNHVIFVLESLCNWTSEIHVKMLLDFFKVVGDWRISCIV